MRTGSKVLLAAGTLAVVVIAGVVVYVATLDANALVAPAAARIKAATGRDLTVGGGASIALSWSPRIVLRDVALSNAPWGTAKHIATAQRLELEVALRPLLAGRVELRELTLIAPAIALETDAKGRRNWDFAPAQAVPAPGADAGGGALALAIADLAVDDGTLTFRDGATGGVTTVAIERLAVSARDTGAPVRAQFRGRVDAVAVALAGTLGPLDALLQKRWPYPVDVQGEVAGQKASFAAKVAASGTRYTLDELKLGLGGSAVTGALAVETGGARAKLSLDLSGPAIALNALPVPAAAAAPPAAAPPPKSGRAYVIPDVPVSFAPLRAIDAQGSLRLERLTLPDGRALERPRAKFSLDGGRLAVSDFAVGVLGGTLAGSAVVDATRPERPALSVDLTGKGMALGEILKAIGPPRDVRGGATDVHASLAMHGASPHAWAASASGQVRVVVGPATLGNTRLDLDSALDRLTQAVNPFRTSDPSTELTCAVARLQLKDGVARVDRSIAAETRKLGVSVSGTLDFRDETLDFTFQPKVRKGIAIDLANVAELVRVSGPFAHPAVSVDPMGSAKAIASIGAAVGTGGLSVVAQSLFSWADGKGPGPCQIALGAAAPSTTPASPAASDQVKPLVDDVGRAVGKLFGR